MEFLEKNVDLLKKDEYNKCFVSCVEDVTGERIKNINIGRSRHRFNEDVEMFKPNKKDRTPGTPHYTKDAKMLFCFRNIILNKYSIEKIGIEVVRCADPHHCPSDRRWVRINNQNDLEKLLKHLSDQGYVFGNDEQL